MRAYLAVLPEQIDSLLRNGTYGFSSAFATTRLFFEENSEVDEEEREFELSLLAAQESREMQESEDAQGFVLAVNLTSTQSGAEDESENPGSYQGPHGDRHFRECEPTPE